MAIVEVIFLKSIRSSMRCGVAFVVLSTCLAGCSGIPPSRMAADEPPISSHLKIPALKALPDRGSLTIKQLAEGLRQFVNEEQGNVAKRLTALYAQWKVAPPRGTASVMEADLDGDGISEVVTALNDASSAVGSGTIFIIYNRNGQYHVDRAPTTVLGAGLNTIADLNQDGRQEIIWSSTSSGANTTYATLYVAAWEPGHVANLPTEITTAYPQVVVDDGNLLVSGGLAGGYGAGKLQRVRTDRYSWQGDRVTLIDQRYAPSSYSYHRLQDGIVAEQWNRTEDAATAYREAMEPDRLAAKMEDSVPPEWRDRFSDSVRTFARFRLDMLLERPDRDTACQAAISWAEAHPDFLEALNKPRGWANPQWKLDDLCGPLPNLKGAKTP